MDLVGGSMCSTVVAVVQLQQSHKGEDLCWEQKVPQEAEPS